MEQTGSIKRQLNIRIKRIVLFTALLFLSVFSSKVNYLGAMLSLLEAFIVLYYVLSKCMEKAYISLVVFLSCALEEKTFVYLYGEGHNLYSIINLPVVSIFFFYGITVLLFAMTYSNVRSGRYTRLPYSSSEKKFLKYLPCMFLTGLFTGLITFIVNDNGINSYSWTFTAFFSNSMRIITMMCFAATGMRLLHRTASFRNQIENVNIELLFSYSIVATITVILRWHGYYGALEEIMLMPLASSLCPILIVIPAMYTVKHPYVYFTAGIIFTVETLFYNSLMGSKFYMVPLLAILMYVITALKKGRVRSLAIALVAIGLVISNGGAILNLIKGSEYGSWKFNQFLNFLNISQGGIFSWYNNIDASPRFRIDEFVNIFLEYVKKPWYMFFGKGNAGTILHTWGTTNWLKQGGTFGDYQINSGIFMSMHESINVLFLRHGLLGIAFFLSTLRSTIKKLTKTPWAIAGVIWLLFYWGIYVSWWLGLFMLVMAINNDEELSVE